MDKYLPVFKSASGKEKVYRYYDRLLSEWPVEYEEKNIITALGETHLLISGRKDSPPLFLVHALYATGLAWIGNVKTLSEYFHVYVIDMIGDPGKSQPSKIIRNEEEILNWLIDILSALNIEKAHFAGNSIGAYHLVNFSLKYPGRINKLILIGPAATFRQMMPFYIHGFSGGLTGWEFMLRHSVNWLTNKAPLPPGWIKLFHALLKSGRGIIQIFPRVFTDEELKKISKPLLLIYGDKENIYNYKKAIQRARNLIPGIKIEIIPNANHFTALSQPELTNQVMVNFLLE